jgi:hypothetical protein
MTAASAGEGSPFVAIIGDTTGRKSPLYISLVTSYATKLSHKTTTRPRSSAGTSQDNAFRKSYDRPDTSDA